MTDLLSISINLSDKRGSVIKSNKAAIKGLDFIGVTERRGEMFPWLKITMLMM